MAMPVRFELLRSVNVHAPDVVEKVIAFWGTADLHFYVNEALRMRGEALPEEAKNALAKIVLDHAEEFPQHAAKAETAAEIPPDLAANESFQIVNQRFSRIGKRLAELWGHDGCTDYINDLLNDTRGGRQGFPPDVAIALFRLESAHDAAFPHLVKPSSDIWSTYNKPPA
jgi:hypothetical protein